MNPNKSRWIWFTYKWSVRCLPGFCYFDGKNSTVDYAVLAINNNQKPNRMVTSANVIWAKIPLITHSTFLFPWMHQILLITSLKVGLLTYFNSARWQNRSLERRCSRCSGAQWPKLFMGVVQLPPKNKIVAICIKWKSTDHQSSIEACEWWSQWNDTWLLRPLIGCSSHVPVNV